MNQHEVVLAVDESGQDPVHVVAVFDVKRCGLTASHVGGVITDDDRKISSDVAIEWIEAGRVLDMIPPPGAPAHAAHVATGFPLLLQVKVCELCGQKVLFA